MMGSLGGRNLRDKSGWCAFANQIAAGIGLAREQSGFGDVVFTAIWILRLKKILTIVFQDDFLISQFITEAGFVITTAGLRFRLELLSIE